MTEHDDEVPPSGIIDVRSASGPVEDEPVVASIDRLRNNEPRRRVPRWLFIVPVIVLLALIGLLLFGPSDGPSDPGSVAFADENPIGVPTSETSTAPPTTSTTVESTTTTAPAPTTTTPKPSTTRPAPTTTPSTTIPSTTTSAAPAPPPTEEPAERGAVYRDGKLFLEGPVPSQEVAEAFVEKASAVIGAENVINNYVLDPSSPIPTDGRVTVDEPFLFASNSADLSPEYTGILDLGIAVMNLNPNVTMVVIGHTDDIGTPKDNRVLSKRRAREVVEYMAWRGIDRTRFEIIGKGESEPIASNDTVSGRGLNRRIEVELLGLLND